MYTAELLPQPSPSEGKGLFREEEKPTLRQKEGPCWDATLWDSVSFDPLVRRVQARLRVYPRRQKEFSRETLPHGSPATISVLGGRPGCFYTRRPPSTSQENAILLPAPEKASRSRPRPSEGQACLVKEAPSLRQVARSGERYPPGWVCKGGTRGVSACRVSLSRLPFWFASWFSSPLSCTLHLNAVRFPSFSGDELRRTAKHWIATGVGASEKLCSPSPSPYVLPGCMKEVMVHEELASVQTIATGHPLPCHYQRVSGGSPKRARQADNLVPKRGQVRISGSRTAVRSQPESPQTEATPKL